MLTLVQITRDYPPSGNPASSTCIHVGKRRGFQWNQWFILGASSVNRRPFCLRLAGAWGHQNSKTEMKGVVSGK